MGKSFKVIRYASCLTVILIISSFLPTAALAWNGDGAGNDVKNEKPPEIIQKKELIREEIQVGNQTGNEHPERTKLQEEAREMITLKEHFGAQKSNYQSSRKDFLTIRKQLQAGNYSEKELEITRAYLNSSIDYMIAHLEKVKYNLEKSNGAVKDARIAAIEDRISQLQEEKEAIEKAESFEDFVNAADSVSGVWNNVKYRTAMETGLAAGEKIDEFIGKSESASKKLEKEIENLNRTGVDTADLEAKFAAYIALTDSARENNEAAKGIYNKENATQEELQVADNNLQSVLKNIKEANEVLKEIFAELEQYKIENASKARIQNNPGTGLNGTGNANNTGDNSSASSTSGKETGLSSKEETNNISGKESGNSSGNNL